MTSDSDLIVVKQMIICSNLRNKTWVKDCSNVSKSNIYGLSIEKIYCVENHPLLTCRSYKKLLVSFE